MSKTFVRNCLLVLRDGDGPVFVPGPGDTVCARLDGYAIVPREKYEALLNAAPRESEGTANPFSDSHKPAVAARTYCDKCKELLPDAAYRCPAGDECPHRK